MLLTMKTPNLNLINIIALIVLVHLKRPCKGSAYMNQWDAVHTLPRYESSKCMPCRSIGLPFKPDAVLPPTCKLNSSQPGSPDFCILFDDFTDMCCDLTNMTEPYKCVQDIRQEILKDEIKFVPPKDQFTKPVVEYRLSFEMVHDINIKESTASIIAELGLKWKDPRLAWNISGDFCQPQIKVKASESPETTEIWVPDFNLINRVLGVESWNEVMAFVNFDGTVTWLRSGMLQAFCSFQGMGQIPFETLGCQFMFGNKGTSSSYQLVPKTPFELGIFRQKYKEFRLLEEKVK